MEALNVVPDEPSAVQQPDESLAAVTAIYQAERNDLASLLGHNLQLIGLGIAYMGAIGVLMLLDPKAGDPAIPSWLALAAPFPTFMVMAFIVIMLANVLVHNESVRLLEKHILNATGWPAQDKVNIGAVAGDAISNIDTQPGLLKIQTLIAYGGFALIVIGFAWRCFDVAENDTGITWFWWLAIAFYVALTIVTVLAYVYVVTKVNGEDSQWVRDRREQALSEAAGS